MSSSSCRFIHAGDLHLEQPLDGFDTLPDSLRERIIAAPLAAAERVFETAILENVDFLLLSGGILHPERAGPQALQFLCEQFALLQEHNVTVFWGGAAEDGPEQWPTALKLPENVMRFSAERVATLHAMRGGEKLAAIHGTCSDVFEPQDYQPDPDSSFNITLGCAPYLPDSWRPTNMDYWALSGQPQHLDWQGNSRISYCGTTQGRNPDHSGAHGCLLIEIAAEEKIRRQLFPTDVVRFQQEYITWAASESASKFEDKLVARARHLHSDNGEPPRVITWVIDRDDSTHVPPTSQVLQQWLTRLRREFGAQDTPLWTRTITLSGSHEIASSLLQEQTLLGDYLRVLREGDLSLSSSEPITLAEFPRNDRQLLEQIANLGLDRLRHHEVVE